MTENFFQIFMSSDWYNHDISGTNLEKLRDYFPDEDDIIRLFKHLDESKGGDDDGDDLAPSLEPLLLVRRESNIPEIELEVFEKNVLDLILTVFKTFLNQLLTLQCDLRLELEYKQELHAEKEQELELELSC